MAERAKQKILKRVNEEGHTDSYGMLLYLAAVMDFDPMALGPDSSAELTTWSGHFDGLRASLLWLAMFERKIGPEDAAKVVDRHITSAVDEVAHGGSSGSWG